jgi:ribosomal protein S18 acetylase RimI-like enzyme
MEIKNIIDIRSKVCIRQIEYNDFKYITDIYYRCLDGDFVGACGRLVFLNYLKYLYNSWKGSLWCVVTEERKVIGFSIGVVDRKTFNRKWFWRNIVLIVPLIVVKLLFAHDFRKFLFSRISDKVEASKRNNSANHYSKSAKRHYISVSNDTKNTVNNALLVWIAIDKAYRGRGYGSRLLEAVEKDLKEKGVTQICGSVSRTNIASISVFKKNDWQFLTSNNNYYKLIKEFK